jgi:hypothetical protein
MDIVSMPTSPEKPNCCMSWGTIPEGAELANVLRNIIISKKSTDIYIRKDNHALRTRRAATIVMYHLRNDDQF